MYEVPAVIFVYNRPEHTKITLNSIGQCMGASETNLFVFSDAPKTERDEKRVEQVRALLGNISGFKTVTVVEQEVNLGLANSIISGVTQILDKHKSVIVFEDDMRISRTFLQYANYALSRYEKNSQVFSIGGWTPSLKSRRSHTQDYFLSYRCCTWGWGTWKDRWEKVDWEVEDYFSFKDNKFEIEKFCRGGSDMIAILDQQMRGAIDSWGIRWDYAHYKNQGFCLRPTYSLVHNIGNDGTGVHCGSTSKYDVELWDGNLRDLPIDVNVLHSQELNLEFRQFYDETSNPKNESLLENLLTKAKQYYINKVSQLRNRLSRYFIK